MSNNEQRDGSDFSLLKELAREGDRVLVVGIDSAIEPPRDLSVPCVQVRMTGGPAASRGLRQVDPANTASWEEFLRCCEDAIREVGRGLLPGGVIHILASCPQAAGAWIGRRLSHVWRSAQLMVYQKGREQPWTPWYFPSSRAVGGEAAAVFGEPRWDGSGGSNPVVVLVLDVVHRADEASVQRVADQAGASSIRRVAPRSVSGTTWLTGDSEVRGAVRQLEEALLDVVRDYPGHAIHILTSAPLSLLIVLGTMVKETVHTSVVVYHFDPARGFRPVLDLVSGQLADHHRHTLRIFWVGEDKRLHYELDGRTLPTSASDMRGRDNINRRAIERGALMHPGVREASSNLVPPSVQTAISGLKNLDIMLEVSGNSAKLAWELLSFANDRFLATEETWTLARLLPGGESYHRSAPSGPVKLVVIPALKDKSMLGWLDLHEIQRLHTKGVFEVCIAPPGMPIQEIRQFLKREQPTILQWVGHGSPDSLTEWNHVLEIETLSGNDPLDRAEMRHLLSGCHNLRLVMLCACRAGVPSSEFGVPRNLLLDGKGAVVAFRDEVGIGEVGRFSVAVYRELTKGKSIAQAVTAGRRALFESHDEMSASAYGAPLLFCTGISELGPLLQPIDQTT